MEIFEQLKRARVAKGLSQAQLGQKMGLPQSHISNIESGKIDIRLSSFQEIAQLLDLEIKLIPRSLASVVEAIVHPETAEQPRFKPDED
jgi:HTH-type transcriptional regulator / antitoxin HipB